ncbi:MAG: Aminopeptidase [Gemmataceae bacterium]|nr:Aminopeptidase [Gemmataceae bacterium]
MVPFVPLPRPDRVRSLAAVLVLPALCLVLTRVAPAAETAPAPRAVDSLARQTAPEDLDRALLSEVKANAELMKNLQYVSDVIGPRLTGSKNLERANEWTAAKMKEYGLENVRLEPWEIPIGWERGPASMTVVDPDTRVRCLVAAVGWTPGTKGKVTGEVVVLTARTKADLDKYKGKLKNAVVITGPPATVAPVTDLSYGPLPPPPAKKDAPKKDEPKKEAPKTTDAGSVSARPVAAVEAAVQPAAKDQPKTEAPKKDEPKKVDPPPGVSFLIPPAELDAFLKAEGVACRVSDAAKPHGLLVAYGGWRGADRAATQDAMPRLVLAHEHFAMLYRLATRPAPAVTKVEVEISNTFVPGPITCFNTVGEVRGAEKPDEFVVVGAHLDSWDLATGTMDNASGSCVVLETARAVATLAKQGRRPKRTIRFVLFTGEEQGLHGSRQYVTKHQDEMDRTSVALVHDTGTGRVYGFGVHGQAKTKEILEPELATLAGMEGWRGLDLGGVFGSDHQSFHPAGVPGFACRQDIDEYRLTHHTQTDTFDHAKGPNLIQGAQVMAVTAVRVANLPELLPRNRTIPKKEPKDPAGAKKTTN